MPVSNIKKINSSFLLAIIVLVSIMLLSYRSAKLFQESAKWTSHTREVLETTERVLSLMKDLETGQRGYAITGDLSFLRPYEMAINDLDPAISKLQRLTADNLSQQQKIRELVSLKKQKLEHLEKVIDLRKNGKVKEAYDLIKNKHGFQAMSEFRDVIQSLKEDEYQLLEIRNKHEEESLSSTLFIILFGGITSLAILILAVYFINRTEKQRLEAVKDVEEQNLIRSGLLQLNKQLAGEQSIASVSDSIMQSISQFLNAQAGAIYLLNQNTKVLEWTGGYSLAKEQVKTFFELGEGFVGQAAKDKKSLTLDQIPSSYWKLSSGLIESVPRTLHVFPILFNGEIKAVGELGTMNPLRKHEQDYLKLGIDAIGIALNSAQSREQVAELLQKTQFQAEELQAQQEELKAGNEDLQEKTVELETQQEELRQINEELEVQRAALEEKQINLEKINRQVEKTSKYKSEFLANMSHELRTPLNSILLLSKLLSENQEKNLLDDQKESLNTIYGSGSDLLNLINDILDLSKVEAGKLDLNISQMPISEICNSLKNLFKAPIAAKNLTFNIEVEEQTPEFILTDRFRLEQILKNFISNAIKFTSQGSVTLRFYPSSDLTLAIAVKDTGIGIPKEKQGLIFEAFEQVDSSISRKYGGTGLGLTIARELTHLLGGHIQMDSQEGVGSTFTITLPIKLDSPQQRFTDKPITNDRPKGTLLVKDNRTQKILLVEDNKNERDSIYRHLTQKDLNVVAVENGKGAIEQVSQNAFDCIILDLKLGDMTGFDFLKHLEKNKTIIVPPIIVYTGKDLLKEELLLLREFSTSIIIKGPKSEERLLNEIVLFLGKPQKTKTEEKSNDSSLIKHSRDIFQGKKILVVDDDVRNIFSLRKILNSKGFEVLSAMDGKEALSILKQNSNVDIILMDIMMPEMDGYECTKAIRSMSHFTEVPIITLTAKAMSGDREKCLEAGASDYLSKPIDMDKLITLLKIWLTRK